MTQAEPVRLGSGPFLITVESITVSSFSLGFLRGQSLGLSLLDAIVPLQGWSVPKSGADPEGSKARSRKSNIESL